MDIKLREFSGEGEGRNRGEEKVQGRRSRISRHKIMGKDKKWYRKQKTQRSYMYKPWT